MPTNDITPTIVTPSPKKALTASNHNKSNGSTYQVSDETRQLLERCRRERAENKRVLEQSEKNRKIIRDSLARSTKIVRELTESHRRRLGIDGTPMPVVSSSKEKTKPRKEAEATNHDSTEKPLTVEEIIEQRRKTDAMMIASIERCHKMVGELKASPQFACR